MLLKDGSNQIQDSCSFLIIFFYAFFHFNYASQFAPDALAAYSTIAVHNPSSLNAVDPKLNQQAFTAFGFPLQSSLASLAGLSQYFNRIKE